MPSVDYGKGCECLVGSTVACIMLCVLLLVCCLDRVGSEFWSQQVQIGNEATGIKCVCVFCVYVQCVCVCVCVYVSVYVCMCVCACVCVCVCV